jgi:hypothetical protein
MSPLAPPRAAREETWGEPDAAKVKKLFERRFAEVKRCYATVLESEPTTRGKFTLRFVIAPGGELREVSVASSTFRRRDVPDCVAATVRRWRTPFRPQEPVAIEYPFRFTPGG